MNKEAFDIDPVVSFFWVKGFAYWHFRLVKIRMERIFMHGVHGILVLFHEFLVPMKPQCLTCLQIWVKINCIDFHSLIVKFLNLFPMINFPTLILMYLENFRTAVCIWTSFHFNYILFARTLLTFVCLAFSHWKYVASFETTPLLRWY